MTNQAILEKAVHKAIENGWDNSSLSGDWEEDVNNYKLFIYDHRFAKALWEGTQLNSLAGTYVHDIPEWKYRLQEMVVSEDPIQYLGEHI